MADHTDGRIAARGLTRMFTPDTGVRDVDIDVGAGEIHALVGLNGAGKTTVMRLMLGMLKPDSGQMTIDGRDLRSTHGSAWARVGHFVDHPLVYGDVDSRTNVRIAAVLHGVPPDQVSHAVDRTLVEWKLTHYASVRARVLSRGNWQRVGLAGALVHDPDVIVLDEPTSALDPAGVMTLRESLIRRAADGAGILVSSHHLDEVARIADRITVMNGGTVIGSLDPGGIDIEREFFAFVHSDDERRSVRQRDPAERSGT